MKRRLAFLRLVSALLLILVRVATASAIWYVDGVNGNDGNDCTSRQTASKTIGHAISLASSGDTIGVGPATYTENLYIGINLRVIGANASATIIDGGGAETVVTTGAGANVTLSRLTIRNGRYGGIKNKGSTLTINNSIITANGFVSYGGGVSNYGSLTINGSTISNNSAFTGGAIFNNQVGTLSINNSTISGNSGGGVLNYNAATISNSTIAENSGGYGIQNVGAEGRVVLQNSIIANNLDANCFSPNRILISKGYNLSSDGSCNHTIISVPVHTAVWFIRP